MNFLTHPVTQCLVNPLMALHAALAREFLTHHHCLKMPAVAAHAEICGIHALMLCLMLSGVTILIIHTHRRNLYPDRNNANVSPASATKHPPTTTRLNQGDMSDAPKNP